MRFSAVLIHFVRLKGEAEISNKNQSYPNSTYATLNEKPKCKLSCTQEHFQRWFLAGCEELHGYDCFSELFLSCSPLLFTGLRETTGSESDGGDSSSTKSEGANGTVATAAIQPKKVKGVGFGDIFKDKPIKLRPRSIEVENDFLPVEKVRSTVSLSFQLNVEYPKVLCRVWCLRCPAPPLGFQCSQILAAPLYT